MQDRGRAAIMPRLNALPRIGLRQLLIALSLAGIVPLAIVATVLLVALWRAQQAELARIPARPARTRSPSRWSSAWTARAGGSISLRASSPSAEALARRRDEILAANPDWSGLATRQGLGGTAAVSGLEVGVPVVRDGKVAFGLVATLRSDRAVGAAALAAARSVARGRNRGRRRTQRRAHARRRRRALQRARRPIPGTRWTLTSARPPPRRTPR